MSESTENNAELLAKSDNITLYEHTTEVIRTIIKIYDKLPSSVKKIPFLLESGIIAAFFHDIGKAHPEFQKLLKKKNNRWNHRRHEVISSNFFLFSVITQKLKVGEKDLFKSWILSIWLAIILHHKAIVQVRPKNRVAYFKNEQIGKIPFLKLNKRDKILDYKPIFENFEKIKSLSEKLNKFIISLQLEKEFKKIEFKMFKSKLNDDINFRNFLEFSNLSENQSDWSSILRENEQYNLLDYNLRFKSALLLGLLKSADHLASGAIQPIKIPRLNNYPIKINPYPFQKKVGHFSDSLIIRAPTGAGKTLAAIMWAQNNQLPNSRLLYILPFQASLNAMYRRFFKFLYNKNLKDVKFTSDILVGISHAKNLAFLESFFDDTDYKFVDPNALKALVKEVYFPIKVSTAHQLLRLILFGKGWEQLLLETVDSLVVFDEIHAYEPRLLGLIIGLMKILRKLGAKILIMTATIPTFIIHLINKEVFPDKKLGIFGLSATEEKDKEILFRKRHNFKFYKNSFKKFIEDPSVLQIINHRYELAKTQLFICNTVSTAQYIYEFLKKKLKMLNQKEILLFHSRFNEKDREEIENSLINDEKNNKTTPKILIATQVVEVSLDLDFEFGYFEIAPIDALIQRMGRVNRQGLKNYDIEKIANITIMKEGINDGKIYDSELKRRTIEILRKNENFSISEMDLLKYVDDVYPSFLLKQKIEFDKGINHSNILYYEDKFEVGKQMEWVLDLIQDCDSIIEVIPKDCVSQFTQYWNNNKYSKAKKLFLSLNLSHFPPNIILKELKIGSRKFFALNDNSYLYNSEYGLRRKA